MVKIREMDIADYDDVIKLWGQTEGMSLRDADSKESINNYLIRNPNLSFVAVSANEIVGAVLVGTDGRRGYLQHLAVSSNFRGKSLGRKLVSQAISALANVGVPKTHLFVYNENVNAQQFYEKLGWFPRDEVRMYSYNSSSNNNV
ncbi:GNAT family N-acetyltransferase [Vibrio parahaemolyticus]|uniref:GNAT family N-acetyltransferase n=1 Tax=Vibrio parahaemolyticus TaxID=670 RepID=UPI00041A83E2|nr:GNAT family N-acetyltransferase [Vibrio parahaemolyticus]EGQ8164531.1 GNAT family N-acetyltransferase [Vibrio parahaemolyticus]EGR0997669.1 GNAT family N-acetyltransferase [Vibrio parahaemolyticus]EGR3441784.1 GNAT family N-acetyltransferase [Vibrio parahaemolyticus]EHH2535219.1 GNAT family N-acetyltransferase [Vibrio parahaemolyticus]EHU5175950.1 GNAT family N-acetyltransferase [Vibrio parahaemolyticus]